MRTTVSLPDALAAYVDENFASENTTDAQAIRDAINRAQELEQRADEQAAEIEELRQRVERLEREKRQILAQREEHTQLVEYVEQERTAQERYRHANLLQKLKWTVTGVPKDDE